MTDDGIETEEVERDGVVGYRWTYQSDGGAFFQSGRIYKSRAAARKAGRAWVFTDYRRNP